MENGGQFLEDQEFGLDDCLAGGDRELANMD